MPKLLRVFALAFLFGCPVQEPTPERLDLGVESHDASLDCTLDPSICVRGESCDQSRGECVPNTSCVSHLDCRTDLRCVNGLCAVAAGRCFGSTDCEGDERCAPSGVCVRDLDDRGLLLPICSESSPCALGTSCVAGVCASCAADRPCPGAQVCRLGRCEEPATCRASSDCFPGHECRSGACARPVAACVADPENDEPDRASPLFERSQSGFELCGLDVDWYSMTLEAYIGARFIITPEPSASGSLARIEATVWTDRGDVVEGASTLDWPGRTIVEVPGLDERRELRLAISGNQNTRYAIDAERIQGLCAGDFLDLLGDGDPEPAPVANLARLRTLEAKACPGDVDRLRVPLQRDELLRLGLEMEPEAAARLRLTASDPSAGNTWTRAFTATVTDALVLPRQDEDGEIDLDLRAERAPELGAAYRWLADLETAERFQACQNPAEAVSQPSLDLSAFGVLGLSSCGAERGLTAESILRVRATTVPTLLRATVRSTSSTTAEVGVRLLEECTRDSSERSCDVSPRPGLGASIEYVLTSTEPVFLSISTTEPRDPLSFELSFDEDDNFTCIGGRADRIDSSGVQVVSTIEATASFDFGPGSSCGPVGAAQGPDRFFELDVAARETVVLELSGRPDGLLWVGTTCARLAETCTAAASIDDIASPARVVLTPSATTRYVVAVDGYGVHDAGAYELRTLFSPECLNDAACSGGERCDDYVCSGPPPNDQCPGTTLSVSGEYARASGSTAAGFDDFASEVCSGGAGGSDVVFELELPAPATRLEARVTRATFDPLLYLRRNLCESPEAELGCNDDRDLAAGDLLPFVSLTNVPAGTYYVIVDAYSFGTTERGGTFDLEVRVIE